MSSVTRTPTRSGRPAIDRDERLAHAVHELTTPLAAIRLATQLLGDPDPAVVAEARVIIDQQAERMTAILRELAAALAPPRRPRAKRDVG